jgi:hypothetical protein
MKHLLTALLIFAAAACQGAQPGLAPTTASESAAARVVDASVDAYNRHDLDAYAALFAPSARVYLHPAEVITSGTTALRNRYREQWRENPRLRVQVASRMLQGNYVVDHQHSVGWADGQDVRVVAIYEVRNGRIQNLWFVR